MRPRRSNSGRTGWHSPARLYMNVERAYREFRHEAADAPWDHGEDV